jgi:HEAT repeat protein
VDILILRLFCLSLVIGLGSIVGLAQTVREAEILNTARTIALATEQSVTAKDATTRARLSVRINQATQRLKQMGEPGRLVLQKALKEKRDYVTACSAAYALYLLNPSQVETAVEALMMQMNRVMFTDLALAQRLILAIGAPAVPVLAHHLNDSMVIHLLGAMGPNANSAVPALKRVLGTSNVEVAAALVAIGSADAVAAAKPVLLAALKDPNGPHAKMAVESLGQLGPRAADAVPQVRRALNAVNPDTRLQAAITLADLGDTAAATEALAGLIKDKELHGRFAALQKLSDMGPKAKAAVGALIEVLSDDTDTRHGDRALAAAALISIDPRNPAAAAAIQKASRDPKLRPLLQKRGLLQ